jgi:uncharacterized membrane protein
MTVRLSLALMQLFVALTVLAIPRLAPRETLFGVRVPPGIRATDVGRGALRAFRLWIAVPAVACLLATLWLPDPIFGKLAGLAMLMPVVIGMAAFVAQNRKLKPFAIQPPPIRQTELGPPEGLPWFIWLGAPPLALLIGAALYLHAHWDQIPLRYPVHFGLDGVPNRWVDRTTRGVYGQLVFGGEITLFMLAMAIAGWYGSRRSDPMRKPMVAVMLTAEWTVTLIFCLLPLRIAGGIAIPLPVLVLGPLALLLPGLVYAYRESIKPRDPVDPTPNECWKGGIIYYNPNDAALFVQRRDGLGFTINMANRWSWAIYGGLLLTLASGPFILR